MLEITLLLKRRNFSSIAFFKFNFTLIYKNISFITVG